MTAEVWSCGGGRQSGAIAALIGDGKLPKPDICVMTDTGMERSATWPFVDGFIRPQLRKVGLELTVIQSADWATVGLLSTKGKILMPGFTTQSGAVGRLDSFCSQEWKTRPVKRYIRSLGIEAARCWIGFSIDEMNRVRTPSEAWWQYFYPLIFEFALRKHQCIDAIRRHGWPHPIPLSACWSCPNASDGEWIEMKLHWPADFENACQLENKLRATDPHFYFHRSCVPLNEVDFFAQQSMLPEHGCHGGCYT
jgi:hypothetical protein